LTEPVITVIIITQFNKQGKVKMKHKAILLALFMGVGAVGFLSAETTLDGRHIPGTNAIDPSVKDDGTLEAALYSAIALGYPLTEQNRQDAIRFGLIKDEPPATASDSVVFGNVLMYKDADGIAHIKIIDPTKQTPVIVDDPQIIIRKRESEAQR
jgi:hypothetical protein